MDLKSVMSNFPGLSVANLYQFIIEKIIVYIMFMAHS